MRNSLCYWNNRYRVNSYQDRNFYLYYLHCCKRKKFLFRLLSGYAGVTFPPFVKEETLWKKTTDSMRCSWMARFLIVYAQPINFGKFFCENNGVPSTEERVWKKWETSVDPRCLSNGSSYFVEYQYSCLHTKESRDNDRTMLLLEILFKFVNLIIFVNCW